MPRGRKPGALVLGQTARRVLTFLDAHPEAFLLTSEIADQLGLTVDRTKCALERLLKTGRTMHCVTVHGSRWKKTPDDAFNEADDEAPLFQFR